MKYFYADNPSKPEGPISRENLLHLFDRGEISDTTWVREEDANSWCRLGSLDIFGAAAIDRQPKELVATYRSNSIRRDLAVGLAVTVIGGIVVAFIQRSSEPHPRPVVIQNNVIAVPQAVDSVVPTKADAEQLSSTTSPTPAPAAAVAREEASIRRASEPNSPPTESAGSASQSQEAHPERRSLAEPSRSVFPQPAAENASENYASNRGFQVPSRLQPQLSDEYWTRELESSRRGHGRITPALQSIHLRAIEVTKQEKWISARELWRGAIEMSLCCGDYLNYNLAVAHANAGDWAGAVEPLKTACGFGDLGRAGYALGVTYAHLNRWKEAAQVLRGVGIYSPYSRDARLLLDHVETKLKDEWTAEAVH
jgi:hypothetical protein